MRRLLCVLLFFVAACGASKTDATDFTLPTIISPSGGGTSQISPGVAISRTSGTGPLYVFFDASSTTDSDGTACPSCDTFRDLHYTWSFGDSGAPDWTTGTRTAVGSGNAAYGPVAGHVFASPGTYNVTVTVTDGTNTYSNYAAGTITVADPNTTFSGTNTTCYSGSGTFTNCPSGATQTTSSAFPTGTFSSSHRYLFHCGETYTIGSSLTFTTQNEIAFGAYDCSSAAAPVINASTNIGSIFTFPNTTGTYGKVTTSGLAFYANTHSVSFLVGNTGTGNHNYANNFLFYDDTFDHISPVISMDTADPDSYNAVVASTISSSPNESIYGYFYGLGLIGNTWDHTGTSSTYVNIVRLMGPQRWVTSNNNFTHFDNAPASPGGGVWFTSRCHDVVGSQQAGYGVLSENIAYPSGTGGFAVGTAAATDSGCTNTENIVENNYLALDGNAGGHPTPFAFDAYYSDVRNNILNCTGISGNTNCIQVYKDETAAVAHYMRFYNNTVYDGTGSATQFVYMANTPVGIIYKNNLLYAPSGTSAQMISGTGSGTVESNNTCGTGATTSCAGGIRTDPTFSGTGITYSAANWKPSGYPASAGTSVPSWYDFFGTAWGGTWDLGAVKH